mmetsp:Transcript_147726/g.275243  ORF Transcript_147726/g.275243 Transcript_147726/m.275243 type:complete len:417 (+) Transcript_147726:49-1299(+)
MTCFRALRWSFALAHMVMAWFVILLDYDGTAALAMENTQSRLVRRGSDESERDAPPPGRWLFGSLTMAQDKLPVDEMLPHQLRNSANRGFDHIVLYTSNRGGNKDRTQQTELLDHIRMQGLVNEFIDIDSLDIDWETANSVIDKEIGQELLRSKGKEEENSAQIAFLMKCVKEYDHCAWLDSDIFVHRGTIGWVDLAVQDVHRRPSLAISLPSFGRYPFTGTTFTSRHYVYHTKQMKKLLPLTATSGIPATFEELLQQKLESTAKDPKAKASGILVYQTRSPHSWLIHPPGDPDGLDHIMTRCSSQDVSLKAVIDMVEKGRRSRNIESPTFWRKKESDKAVGDMDAEKWGPRVEEHCSKVLLNGEASQLAKKASDGKLHQWRPFKKWGHPKKSKKEAKSAAKPHMRMERKATGHFK